MQPLSLNSPQYKMIQDQPLNLTESTLSNLREINKIFSGERINFPNLQNLLKDYNLELNFRYKQTNTIQFNTLGTLKKVGIETWKQSLIEAIDLKNEPFVVIGRAKGMCYFYAGLKHILFLIEIPVRDPWHQSTLQDDMELCILLEKMITSDPDILVEKAHLLLVEDHLNTITSQSEYEVLGSNQSRWIAEKQPIVFWIDAYLNIKDQSLSNNEPS